MKKTILIIGILSAIVTSALAQENHLKVSIASKGGDIRATFANLFEQAKKPYVLPVTLKATVYLSLTDIDFESALKILCKSAGLVAEEQEGIYYVREVEMTSKTSSTAPKTPDPVRHVSPKQVTEVQKPVTESKDALRPTAATAISGHSFVVASPTRILANPVNPAKAASSPRVLPISVLEAKVSARIQKGDIRKLFGQFAKQANIKIELGPEVPAYRIDAYLMNTSLKYALDKITDAAGLEYRFTDNYSIAISKPKSERIAINK